MTVESRSDSPRRTRLLLLMILGVALALRLGWGLSRPADDASIDALPDQREYLSLARNLLHGHGLQFIDPRFDDTVRAFRTPGYPLFLAACGANVRAARVVQALIDVATVLAVYLLARRLVGRRGGAFLAAGVIAFNPYLIYFAGLLLSETLFTAMLAWGMLLMTIRPRGDLGRGVGPAWLMGGLILGLSVLVRPSAVALPVLLGVASVFLNPAGEPAYEIPNLRVRRWPLPPGLTMVVLTLLCLLPWAVRNRVVMGHWIWLDTNSGFTLYDGYNPDATGASDQHWIGNLPELRALDEVGRDEYLRRAAQRDAVANPGRDLELAGAKLARTWSPVPLSREYGKASLRLIAAAYSVPFDLLVLAGLLLANLPRSVKVYLFMPAVYFSIIHSLTVGSLRYRVPAEAPLAVVMAGLVGVGGAAAWRRPESFDRAASEGR